MFDALFLNSKSDDKHLRVPLTAMVDYKGFRALCIGAISIDTNVQPALGYFMDKYTCEDD